VLDTCWTGGYSCFVTQLKNATILADTGRCGDLLIDVVPLLMAAIRSESRDLQPPDLSIAQFRALAFIYRHAGQSLSAVAEVLGLSLSAASKVVDRTVELGYVRHEVCPQDRRRARLVVTAKGQATMRRARREMAVRLTELLSGLEPSAREEVVAGLTHLQEIFQPPDAE
jgi:DNA-binding MarR family transcriptional regulator